MSCASWCDTLRTQRNIFWVALLPKTYVLTWGNTRWSRLRNILQSQRLVLFKTVKVTKDKEGVRKWSSRLKQIKDIWQGIVMYDYGFEFRSRKEKETLGSRWNLNRIHGQDGSIVSVIISWLGGLQKGYRIMYSYLRKIHNEIFRGEIAPCLQLALRMISKGVMIM